MVPTTREGRLLKHYYSTASMIAEARQHDYSAVDDLPLPLRDPEAEHTIPLRLTNGESAHAPANMHEEDFAGLFGITPEAAFYNSRPSFRFVAGTLTIAADGANNLEQKVSDKRN